MEKFKKSSGESEHGLKRHFTIQRTNGDGGRIINARCNLCNKFISLEYWLRYDNCPHCKQRIFEL